MRATRRLRDCDLGGASEFKGEPALDGETADEAEPPALRFADRLKIGRCADDLVHGRRIRLNARCCAMRPEVGFGARGGTR